MATTITAPQINAVTIERLISLFTLRSIAARDIMIDAAGVLGFFYGRAGARTASRMQIQMTGPDTYVVEVGHVNARSRVWVVQDRRQVDGSDLRETVRELA